MSDGRDGACQEADVEGGKHVVGLALPPRRPCAIGSCRSLFSAYSFPLAPAPVFHVGRLSFICAIAIMSCSALVPAMSAIWSIELYIQRSFPDAA